MLAKFHRAAADGYLDLLCEASRRDANQPEPALAGLTPTQLAAWHGRLDALRMLVGRGGDPERPAPDGSAALHLASARGHLHCVSFLVNFGANMWALDNELRTAKDVAALEQRQEILDYLDQMMAKQSALSTKAVQRLKLKASRAADKRLKEARKAQLKTIKRQQQHERYLARLSQQPRPLSGARSLCDIKLVGRPTISLTPLGGELASSKPLSGPQSATTRAPPGADRLRNLLPALGRKPVGGWSDGVSTRSSPAPKYSDLVGLAAPGGGGGAPLAEKARSRSLAGSSLGSKLRLLGAGAGGVSRKVHLRRLATAGQESGAGPASTQAAAAPPPPAPPTPPAPPGATKLEALTARVSVSDAHGKLCQLRSPAATSGALWRARSEPDFSVRFELSPEPASLADELELELEQQKQQVSKVAGSGSAADPVASPASQEASPSPSELHQQHQRHLLTKCLSQLKSRHAEQPGSPGSAGSAHAQPPAIVYSHSDELLQHQLTAGVAAIKPSVIKQQKQHLNIQIGCPDPLAANQGAPVAAAAACAADSIGSAGSLAQRSSCQGSTTSTSSSAVSSASASLLGPPGDLAAFLGAHGLRELAGVFAAEQIDLEALLLLTDDDLRSLNIRLGPRRKLLNALARGRAPQPACYALVVDTQL